MKNIEQVTATLPSASRKAPSTPPRTPDDASRKGTTSTRRRRPQGEPRLLPQAGARKKEAEGDLDEASKKGTDSKTMEPASPWPPKAKGFPRSHSPLPTTRTREHGPSRRSRHGRIRPVGASTSGGHRSSPEIKHARHNLVARTTEVAVQHSRPPLAAEPAPPAQPEAAAPASTPPQASPPTQRAAPAPHQYDGPDPPRHPPGKGAFGVQTSQIQPGTNPNKLAISRTGAEAARPGRAEGQHPLAGLLPAKARATGRHQRRSGREATMAARRGLDHRPPPEHGRDGGRHGRRHRSQIRG